jgi:surfeit locus 1 family protein
LKKFRRRDIILAGFFLLVAIVCARMGIWQLDRLQQRRARNAELESRLALPVTTFPPGQAILEPSFRTYTVTGEFDPLHAILLKNQPLDEQAGYHLLVPLLFEDGTPALLVDRGWLPNDLGLQSEPAILAAQLTDNATVTGVLLPSQEQPAMSILGDQIPATGEPPLLAWRLVDLEGIARQLPYDLYPLYLAQTGPPVQSGGFPIPTFEPDLSDGPHVSYAIQWFAFAAISLVGGAALLRRQRASEGLD